MIFLIIIKCLLSVFLIERIFNNLVFYSVFLFCGTFICNWSFQLYCFFSEQFGGQFILICIKTIMCLSNECAPLSLHKHLLSQLNLIHAQLIENTTEFHSFYVVKWSNRPFWCLNRNEIAREMTSNNSQCDVKTIRLLSKLLCCEEKSKEVRDVSQTFDSK